MAVLKEIHADSGQFQLFIQNNLLKQNTVGVLHTDMKIVNNSIGSLLPKGVYGFHGGNTADQKSFKVVFVLQK